jgi:hypothetical protein
VRIVILLPGRPSSLPAVAPFADDARLNADAACPAILIGNFRFAAAFHVTR